MKRIFILLLGIASLFCSQQSYADLAGPGFADPIFAEWSYYARKEVELTEWLRELQAWKEKNQAPSYKEAGKPKDTYIGQMSLLTEEVNDSNQNLGNTPFRFLSYEDTEHADLVMGDVTIGQPMVAPNNSIFRSLSNFGAIWELSNLQLLYYGRVVQSDLADFSDYRYLGAADYIFRSYHANERPKSVVLGLGLAGFPTTEPAYLKEQKHPQTYYGQATVIEHSRENENKRRLIKGSVVATIDPDRNEIQITLEARSEHKFEWTLSYSASATEQSINNVWVCFYGPEAQELGGVFSVKSPDFMIQGVFASTKSQ